MKKLLILLVYSVSSQIFSLTQNDHCLKDRSPDCQGEFNPKQVNSVRYRGLLNIVKFIFQFFLSLSF